MIIKLSAFQDKFIKTSEREKENISYFQRIFHLIILFDALKLK